MKSDTRSKYHISARPDRNIRKTLQNPGKPLYKTGIALV